MLRARCLAAVLLAVAGAPALAWRCPPLADREIVTPAQLFTGVVETVRPPVDAWPAGWGEAQAIVRVEEVLHGPVQPMQRVVREPFTGGASAHALAPGQRHLFFVREDGLLALCGGTRALPAGDAERARVLQPLRTFYGRPAPADRAFGARAWSAGDASQVLALLPQLAGEERLAAARWLAERGFLPAEPSLVERVRAAPLGRGSEGLGALANAVIGLGSQAVMDAIAERVLQARSLPAPQGGPPVYGRLDEAALARLRLEEAHADLDEVLRALQVAPARLQLPAELMSPGTAQAFAPWHAKPFEAMLARRRELQARFDRAEAASLLYFASSGTPAELRSLLARGVDANARVGTDTALLAAVRASRYDNARVLLEAGADPNAADAEGTAPLHVLAREGFAWKQGLADNAIEFTRRLLARGAQPSAAARRGWTPLHLAAAARFGAMVDLLVAAGADVNAQAEDSVSIGGLRPLQIAEDAGDAEIARVLRAHGAGVSASYAAKRAAQRAAVKVLGPVLRGH